jgi:hypothetical protein
VLPETWIERALAAGTVLCTVALVAVAAANWDALRGDGARAASPAAASTAPVGGVLSATTPATTTTSAPPRVRTVERPAARAVAPPAKPKPKPKAPADALTIRAVGGDSWLEARRSDSAGEQLYYGILAEGDSVTLRPLPVWVRAGAVTNLELRLGQGRVSPPPAASNGVSTFTARAAGVDPTAG